MKATLFLLGAVALASSHGAQVLPEPYPDSRYEKLKTEWPFILAKPDEKPAEEKISWAANLYLSSVVMQRTGEGGEQPWVSIRDRQEPLSFIQLTLNEEKDGMQLVKVENLDDPKKTTVTVKKNNEFATLKRDEGAWTATAAPANPGVRAGGTTLRVPGQPNAAPVANPQNAIRMPGAQPAAPNGAPKAPVIPRPTNVFPQPAPQAQPNAVPAGQAPASDARKRIRVINNGK